MSLEYPEKKQITNDIAEAYVQGAWDLFLALGGDPHCKSYDPLTIEGSVAHSYVLDLWDGGRHHKIHNNLQEIMDKAIQEFKERLVEL